ncbi:major facilitator superfamily MFS_1 protein [Nitzschia inconspicua]|uniref:Major facilitator superfamily MFS_1 protein n=1 Tax=Nitzschia inconspicua TaxID=303405 RepID=A0A9K3KHR8_9STRA|nr:major facilitator superfamily MFS_1 protein [Nitzschia inconspicua]
MTEIITGSDSNEVHQISGKLKGRDLRWVSKSSIRFFLCGFVYLTYFTSLAVIGQYLSLFFQSKGFGGKTMGMLTSIAPLTSFLLTPVWGRIMNQQRSQEDSSSGRTVSLPLLYSTIIISVIFQVSVILVNDATSMMVVKTLTGIFHAPVKPLLDAFIMDHIDKSIFGKVRLFGIIGTGLGSFWGGKILLYMPSSDDKVSFMASLLSGYNLLFVLHGLLLIPTVLGMQCLRFLQDESSLTPAMSQREVPFPTSPNHNTQEIPNKSLTSYILHDLDHIIFFLIIYVMGTSGGVSDAFTSPRFREAGLDTDHIGKSRVCSSIAGSIMFWFSSSLVEALGRENVLILSLACNSVRFALLRIMDRPLQGYLAETIRGGIFGSFWSSSTIYSSQIGPPTMRPTLLMVLNGVYNGIGRSTGSLLGGRIQAQVGTETLFGIIAMTNLSMALSAFVYQYFVRPAMKRSKDFAEHKQV